MTMNNDETQASDEITTSTQASTILETQAEGDTALQQALAGITLGETLGQGGMGVVRRGFEEYLDRPVAVKVLHLSGGIAEHEEQFKKRFQREARVLATLQHSNIVSCYRAGVSENGLCFLVMEFIDGPDLRTKIAQEGPISANTAGRIITEVATALEFSLERGIIHRDIKAANILLGPTTNSPDAFPFTSKLADLGLARPANPTVSDLTQPGSILGTPSTMAPEQFDNPDTIDHRADMYGLGCVYLQCLTGKVTFPQQGLNQLVTAKQSCDVQWPADISKPLQTFLRRVLDPNPQNRPDTYENFKRQLSAALGARTSRAFEAAVAWC